MNSSLNMIVLVLGLLFGIEAFASCVTIGESIGAALLQAVGWWGTFSASHFFTYQAIKQRKK